MPLTTTTRPVRRQDRNNLRELLRGAGEQLYLAAQEWPRDTPFPPELTAARAAIRTARERLELEDVLHAMCPEVACR